MQVLFTRWCMDEKGRTPVTVDPKRVDCTEHFGDAFKSPIGDFTAATKIIMKNKQEYVVQGSVADVQKALNEAEGK